MRLLLADTKMGRLGNFVKFYRVKMGLLGQSGKMDRIFRACVLGKARGRNDPCNPQLF